MQGRPFAKDLVVDAGIRRSDYTTSGVVNTYKIELQYAPLDDFRFRGSFQRAIRAPSIVELYNPPNVGQVGFSADPCAPPITASLAECEHTGVTPTQYANGTIPQLVASQVSALTGGNVHLQPEVATSYTLGFNITPTSLPNFTASVDYYHINLKDEIGEYPASILLNQCLATGLPQYCSQIVRSPTTGGLTGATVAGGGYIIQTNVNIGAELVSGFDLQANYKLPLDGFGTLLFSLSGTYLLHNYTTPSPQSLTYDCSGLFGSTCETLNPKWRQNLRVTWSTPWEVEVSALWRYLGKVSLDNNSYYPSLAYAEFGAYNYFNAQIPAYNYLDLSVSWNVMKQVQLRAGVNNLFDKNPPIVTSEITAGGQANTYETYDTLGRQLYAAFTAKF